jgi:AraC-like DNA-binding protein
MDANPTSRSPAQTWACLDMPGISCFRAIASQHTYDRHSHSEYAIGVIEQGIGGLEYRGAKEVIPPPGIVLLNPGDVHTGYAADSRPLSYRMLYVAEAAFRRALDEHAAPYFRQVRLDHLPLARQIHQLQHLLESAPDQLERAEALIATLRVVAVATGASLGPDPGRRHEPTAIAQIKAFLHQHLDQNISIDELATLTHLHRAYLIRVFHQHIGIPPYTYLLQLRVERAKVLLAQGMPIAEVALTVGFTDQSHLTRRLKRITGVTPHQFRKGHYHPRRIPNTLLP